MDESLVRKILQQEKIELANAKQQKHFKRLPLTLSIRFVLWFLRIYVVIAMVLVVYQLYLALSIK